MIIFNKRELQKGSDFILASSTKYKTGKSSRIENKPEVNNKRKTKGINSKLSNPLTESNKKFLINLGFILKK